MSADQLHLSHVTVAAWVDGQLAGEERAQVEIHLAVCAECRREVAEVEDLLARAPSGRRRLPTPLQLAAAAAVLLAIGLPVSRGWQDRQVPPAADRTQAAAITRLNAIAPMGEFPSGTAPVFQWNAADPGSRFRVTLVDEQGATLWAAETGDTVATLPAEVLLVPGQTYFWYVDALGSDGRTLTSGAHRFTVR